MAMADRVLATEETAMLEHRLGSAYLQQSELKAGIRAFEKPMDLEQGLPQCCDLPIDLWPPSSPTWWFPPAVRTSGSR